MSGLLSLALSSKSVLGAFDTSAASFAGELAFNFRLLLLTSINFGSTFLLLFGPKASKLTFDL